MANSLTGTGNRGDFDPVVIRTDFTDSPAWEAVKRALVEPWEGNEYQRPFLVDDRVWAGASVGDALTAIAADENLGGSLPLVFLADGTTMSSDHRGLLVATTVTREEAGDEEAYEAMVEFGREFRISPFRVAEMHVNLTLANMEFEEFAEVAHADPEGVFRSWP